MENPESLRPLDRFIIVRRTIVCIQNTPCFLCSQRTSIHKTFTLLKNEIATPRNNAHNVMQISGPLAVRWERK